MRIIQEHKGMFIIYVGGGVKSGGGAQKVSPPLRGGGGHESFEGGRGGGGGHKNLTLPRVAFFLARCTLLHYTQRSMGPTLWIDLQELINKDFVTTRLEAVFHRLRQFGLKLHPEKCLVPWSHGLCKRSGKWLRQNQGSRRLSNTNNPENSSSRYPIPLGIKFNFITIGCRKLWSVPTIESNWKLLNEKNQHDKSAVSSELEIGIT